MYMYVYVNRFLISFQYNNQYGQQKGICFFDQWKSILNKELFHLYFIYIQY